MELNSKQILEDYQGKKLDKSTALHQLTTLISNSSDIKTRLKALYGLETIGIRGKFFFDFVENLMISDSNQEIRKLAIEIIKKHFLRRAFEPMCWAYKHESSILCLLAVISTLGEIEGPLVKEYLITQLLSINYSELDKSWTNFLNNNDLQKYSVKELAQFLHDYHIMNFLLEKFKRIHYVIQKGRIYELDLSFMTCNIYDPSIMRILPSFFEYLSALKKLDLRLNKFSSIPQSIKNLTELKMLNLSNNNFRYLPEYFSKLHSLRYLNLSHNEIRYLPKTFGILRNLKALDLAHNQILKLPPSFGRLQDLEIINLHGNQLEHIPTELFELERLAHLKLGLNEIRRIQSEMRKLSSLRKLCIGGNRLNQDAITQLMALINLRELDLYDNKLQVLPERIRCESKLKNLSLHNNQLSSLPKDFNKLQSLESLDLSWNNFSQIPEELTGLKNLRYLDLSGNKINSVSSNTPKLENLHSLNLIYNKIHSLSEPLVELKRQGVHIHI